MEPTPKYWLSLLGTGQSGHTIIAACLDAHPNVIVAEEQRYIRKIGRNTATREQILSSCIDYCKRYRNNTYSHRKTIMPINNKWCGTWRDPLLVIGNKMGWEFTGPYMEQGTVFFPRVQRRLGMPVKIIHVVRNPFDVIATWAHSRRQDRVTGTGKLRKAMSVDGCIDLFEKHCNAAIIAVYRQTSKIHLVTLDEFCGNSRRCLRDMCLHLDIEFDDQWAIDCAKHVFSSPRKRSSKVNFDQEQINRINKIIEKYSFLESYRES